MSAFIALAEDQTLPGRRLSRRALLRGGGRLLGAALAGGAAGCGNSGDLANAGETMMEAIGLGPGKQYTTRDVERVPFATLGVRFGSAPEAMVTLAAIETDRRLVWISADRRMLVTRGGRVLRLIGLVDDVAIRPDDGADPLLHGLVGRTGPLAARWTVAYPKRQIFDIPVTAEMTLAGRTEVKTLYETLPATRWVERARARVAGWTFENEYWVTSDGRIRKSRQYLSPELPPIDLIVLRPAAAA